MSGYLLDTDWVIDILNSQQSAISAFSTMTEVGIAASIVTYGELFEGAYYGRDRAAALAKLWRFMSGIQLLPLSNQIVENFGILRGGMPRNHRQQVGDFDLLIAATAFTHQLTIVTRNLRDFRLIPGIDLYT